MRVRVFVFLLLLLMWCGVTAPAAELDLWVVDTRKAHISELEDGGEPSLVFKRWQSATWVDSNREEFLTTHQPHIPTVFLIHGNWTKLADVLSHGRLCERFFSESAAPCRLVIWTWPSERISARPRVDIRTKAVRADVQARHIVRFLRDLKPESCVTLAGFSFGARLASMSLEEIAKSGNSNNLRLRAILMAAAFNTEWLLPNHRFGNAIDAAERIDILYNPRDDKLKYYPLIDCVFDEGPTALGATGLAVKRLRAEDQPKVRSINVVRFIGADHSLLSSVRAMLGYGGFAPVGLFGETRTNR